MGIEREWSDHDRQLLYDAKRVLDQAFNEAGKILAPLRAKMSPREEEIARCFWCTCPDYIAPAPGTNRNCSRAGCGHTLSQHDFF